MRTTRMPGVPVAWPPGNALAIVRVILAPGGMVLLLLYIGANY